MPESQEKELEHTTDSRRRLRRIWLLSNIVRLTIVLIIIAVGALWLNLKILNSSPVPKSIQKSVSYKIYYPDPKKLPPGYNLDTSTFRNNSTAVLYAIRYDNGQRKIFVSNQPKPSGDVISSFEIKTISLHYTYKTSIGTATIGAIAPNAVISLPTSSSVWLIITAPSTIDQSQLKQVLNSLRN